MSKADAVNAFTEQISALAGEPVNQSNGAGEDLFIIETISDLIELDLAVQAACSLVPDIHIIGMITFTRDDRTILGDSPEDLGERISLLDLDAIGVNCSGGPVQVLRVLATLKTRSRGMILVAPPKAGCPQQHEGGHVHYPATPSYFAEYARSFSQLGVKIIGGCCGTNESHIAAMQLSLDTQVR